MSTPVGQSLEQALQDRHRSSDSPTPGSVIGRVPRTTSCRTRARPRVESFSSPVARKLGHITPPDEVRQRPTPMQACTGWAPSGEVSSPRSRVGTPSSARSASRRRVARIPPGARIPAGSHTCANRANARIISAEYMIGRSSERARPSPCSPDSDPPWRTASRAASVQKARNTARPLSDRRSKVMRMCMQPAPKCPYMTPVRPCSVSRSRNSAR